MDAGEEMRAIALDISKPFDKVWHAELLHKLEAYGVVGPIQSILVSFLQECSLKLFLMANLTLYITNAGVLQGSVLGKPYSLFF